MTSPTSFEAIRQALSEVEQGGQHAVDIKALRTFLDSVEADAPLDAEIRKLDHESTLAQYKAANDTRLARYRAEVGTVLL